MKEIKKALEYLLITSKNSGAIAKTQAIENVPETMSHLKMAPKLFLGKK